MGSPVTAVAPPVTAVDKAMIMLTAVLTSGEPSSLAELSRRTGLPKSTAHRLLGILCAHGMVARRDGQYVPGVYVSNSFVPENNSLVMLLRSESTPYLVELHTATGGTASLWMRASTGPVCLNQIYSHRDVRIVPGSPVPQAIGKLFHAYSVGDDAMLPGRPAATELSEIRSTRIAYASEPPRGLVSVAIALWDTGTRRYEPIVLAVSGHTGVLDLSAAARELRGYAHSLTRRIRHHLACPPGRPGIHPTPGTMRSACEIMERT